MSDDFSLNSEEAVKIYAHLVIARADELSLTGALKVLSEENQKCVQDEAKALLPYLRKQMLFQFEDRDASLSARVLAEIGHIDAKNQKE